MTKTTKCLSECKDWLLECEICGVLVCAVKINDNVNPYSLMRVRCITHERKSLE